MPMVRWSVMSWGPMYWRSGPPSVIHSVASLSYDVWWWRMGVPVEVP